MQILAKREEEYMQVLWDLKHAFIKDIIEELPEPKPHYNTVATMIKILEEKEFVNHKKIGNMYQYFPLITREEYQQNAVGELLDKYFNNSYINMVTFFARKEKISPEELESIIEMIKKGKS